MNDLESPMRRSSSAVDYKKEVSAMRSHVQALQETVVQHTGQMTTQRRQLADRDHEVDRLTYLIEEHRRHSESLSRDYEDSKASMALAVVQIANLQETNRALQHQVDLLDRNRKDSAMELVERKEDLTRRAEDSGRNEWQLTEMRRVLEEQTAAFSALQSACSAKDDVMRRKEGEIHTMVLDRDAAHDTLQQWRDKYERANTELNEVRAQNGVLREKMSVASRGVQERDIEVATLTRRLKAKESETDSLSSKSMSQSTSMGKQEEQLRQHSVEVHAWKEKVAVLQVALGGAQDDLRRRDERLDAMCGEVEECRVAIVEQKGEAHHLRTQITG